MSAALSKLLGAALAASLAGAATASAAFLGEARSSASGAAAAAVFAPRSVERPVISGVAHVGQTLTATDGSWARDPENFERVWLRCAERCEPTGASGASYVVGAADLGYRLVVRVTARNAGGTVVAESVPTAPVERIASRNITRPSISGSTLVDELLTADPGEWSGSPALRFQWVRCSTLCTELAGATEPTYRLAGADAGSTIRVRVAADEVAESAPTATVARRTFTQILCADPATGQGVIGDGVLPDGMTPDADRWEFGNMAARSRCSGTMTATRGIPVRPQTRIWTTGWPEQGVALRYRVPSAVAFLQARIHRRLTLAGSEVMSAGINTADADGIHATPRAELCEVFDGCTGFAAGTVDVQASSEINGFNVFLRCAGNEPWWTCGADTGHGYWLYGATATLRDTAEPRLTSAVTGDLAQSEHVAREATLAFSASDAGSGLYRVRVRLDDQVVAERAVAPTDSRCADIDPTDGDAYEFVSPAPCAKSASTAMTFDTTAWPSGKHRLHVIVEDAGRNTAVLANRDVIVGE